MIVIDVAGVLGLVGLVALGGLTGVGSIERGRGREGERERERETLLGVNVHSRHISGGRCNARDELHRGSDGGLLRVS